MIVYVSLSSINYLLIFKYSFLSGSVHVAQPIGSRCCCETPMRGGYSKLRSVSRLHLDTGHRIHLKQLYHIAIEEKVKLQKSYIDQIDALETLLHGTFALLYNSEKITL